VTARFDWEAAGVALGDSLGQYTSLVVIGIDPVTTGHVAVGIARAQARTRRVAVGDLFAESPPIQALVTSDDPHGLVDSFLYGVSLSRIAHQVPDAGQLYVMPSGTEPPTYDEILANPRWHRLTAGFREVGALLVLAAPASAPHLEDLVGATDGAILVGEAVPRKLPVSRVISSVREPQPEPDATEALEAPPTERRPARRWTRRQRFAATAGVALTLALAFVAFWLATRPISIASRGHTRVPQKADTAHAKSVLALDRDSAPRDSVRDSAAAGPLVPVLSVTNPADSAVADWWSVELSIANTQAGAILDVQQYGMNLPAATFSPVLIQGAPWFKILSGAFETAASADSLLQSLRKRGYLTQDAGKVVRAPYAFLIEVVTPAAVEGMLAAHSNHGIPVYALRQTNGKVWLLAGAFETKDQASSFTQPLRAAGIEPVLVYRKGRMF
jgi:hypothetical protein